MLLRDDCVLRLGSAAQGAYAQHVAALVVNQPPFHSFIIPGRTWGRCWPFVAMQAFQYGMPYVFISSHLSWVLHVRDLDFSFCTPVPDGPQSVGEAEASRSVLLPRLTRGAQSRFEDAEAVQGVGKWSLAKLAVEQSRESTVMLEDLAVCRWR